MNPHDVLGVDKGMSLDEIKKVYNKLCLIYHPDKGNINNDMKFKEINRAWEMIRDGVPYREEKTTQEQKLFYNEYFSEIMKKHREQERKEQEAKEKRKDEKKKKDESLRNLSDKISKLDIEQRFDYIIENNKAFSLRFLHFVSEFLIKDKSRVINILTKDITKFMDEIDNEWNKIKIDYQIKGDNEEKRLIFSYYDLIHTTPRAMLKHIITSYKKYLSQRYD